MRAVRLPAPGPVDNLRLTTLPLPPERDGWVRIRVAKPQELRNRAAHTLSLFGTVLITSVLVTDVTGQTSCIHWPSARRRTSWPDVMTAPHTSHTCPGACASLPPHAELSSSS